MIFTSCSNLSSSNALITEIYPEAWTITPNQIGFTGNLEISYTVNDEYGGNIDGTSLINFKALSYSEVESNGNITLLKNETDYAFAQDEYGNTKAITYYGDHLSLNTWENWSFLAAENIDGINSVIWKYSFGDSSASDGLMDANSHNRLHSCAVN